MHLRPIGIYFSALFLYVLALPIYAQDTCPEGTQVSLIQLALSENGYRPLSPDEVNEMTDSQNSSESNSSEHWRPETTTDDCQPQQSLVNPEDRGYRPLDYGSQGQQGSPSVYGHPGYLPGYGGNAYRQNYAPQRGLYQSPAYPDATGNRWSEGASPYYTQPPMLPGYGIMPYSFGGNGSVPY